MEQPSLNYIEQLSAGDGEFKTTMINVMKNELPSEIEMYQNFIDSNDFTNAAQMVHKLKHKISLLGLENSYKTANQYEKQLNAQQLELKSSFNQILNKMTVFIKSL